MKVLLVVTDLYRNIGGGQTVYRRIIESCPEVQFTYLRDFEPYSAVRPAHTDTVQIGARRRIDVDPPTFPAYKRHALADADRVACAVAGRHFDIVDVPDYLVFGGMLRDAFAVHGVTFDRLVLAMHGNISNSIELNWGSAGDNVLEQRILEREQFADVDGAYGISSRYIRQWQAINPRRVNYIDPIRFVSASLKRASNPTVDNGMPDVCCIGRSERLKGNDIFVEMVRWLRVGSFGTARHFGDQDFSLQGISSGYILSCIARNRNIEVDHGPALDREGLAQVFARRSLIVLPVRYDSLNLVALEAMFSGCPVAVSNRAGVCDYLDATHPGLPYIAIDLNRLYSSIPMIQAALDNYDSRRRSLVDYLNATGPHHRAVTFSDIYGPILDSPRREASATSSRVTGLRPEGEKRAQQARSLVPYGERTLSFPHLLRDLGRRFVGRVLGPARYQAVRSFSRSPRSRIKYMIRRRLVGSKHVGDAKFLSAMLDSSAIPSRLRDVSEAREHSDRAIHEKLQRVYGHAENPLFRCNFWLEIARLERQLGHEQIAVAYELRILRLLGDDRLGLLPRTASTLIKLGFRFEAEVAEAMFADPARSADRVHAYLTAAYLRNRTWMPKPFEWIDDRRTGSPRVAVVVSLYRAAAKLRFFLSAICQQTMASRNEVEFILVDSGSPTDERSVFESFVRDAPLNAVFARSADRETIQAAWNRGISLAKAPYLVFLGVDEMLYPEALDVLATTLDSSPSTDWVMSNSLVTAVEPSGLYKNDVMVYDRTGATKDNNYLETCYLSYVGGMYRKSIHERFGYYDESFGGAGDTEFKNRILSHIEVRFIPQTLGIFLDYPDERATASPKAEIEDLRAWYAHRSAGGVRYAFAGRPVEDVRRLLGLALGYRKSYCRHQSCDTEYAVHLCNHLIERGDHAMEVDATSHGLGVMLDGLRSLEFSSSMPGRWKGRRLLLRAWKSADRHQSVHRSAWDKRATPVYSIFNDNRYEQHSWLWKTSPLASSH